MLELHWRSFMYSTDVKRVLEIDLKGKKRDGTFS